MNLITRIEQHIEEHLALVEACRDLLSAPLAAAAERIVECVMQDGKLLIGGLGSAAPDAERLTARLLHRFEMERPGLAAVNLGASLATMAGIVQDEGGEEVFARQVRSLGHTHDLLLLFCDDHRMLSQARAVEAARERDIGVIAFTGEQAGSLEEVLADQDILLGVPHGRAARVSEVHALLSNALCDAVDCLLLGVEE